MDNHYPKDVGDQGEALALTSKSGAEAAAT
jgi:hypothetical protein